MLLVAVPAAVLALASACGSSGTKTAATGSASPGSGNAASTGAGSGGDSTLAGVQAVVSKAYQGTNVTPAVTPVTPKAGQKVWVISCGQAALGCSAIADAAVAAGKRLGWTMTLYDGKLGVDNAYARGIKQAVAAKADGIIDGAIDCPLMKEPLAEAKTAGVKVVAVLAYDCSDPRFGGGPALFTSNVIPNTGQQTTSAYARQAGVLKAEWVLAQTKGKAVGLSLKHTDSLLGGDTAAGFDSRIKQCAGCRVIDVPFTFADISNGQLGPKISQALLANPTANAVASPYDSLMLLGVAQAVARSGRSAKIASIGGEGLAPNLALIANNQGEDAATFEPDNWFGWAGVDTMVRTLAGQPAVPAGIGLQLIDKDHLPPATNGVIRTLDYQAAYLKAWGK